MGTEQVTGPKICKTYDDDDYYNDDGYDFDVGIDMWYLNMYVILNDYRDRTLWIHKYKNIVSSNE